MLMSSTMLGGMGMGVVEAARSAGGGLQERLFGAWSMRRHPLANEEGRRESPGKGQA